MKSQTTSGYLLIAAAFTFWISWVLMPDPGTTDTAHILRIVKESRMSVLSSVIIQIISSVLYVLALFSLVKNNLPLKKTATGIALLGIGAMGLCADAFFHLLAFFMTSDVVSIQADVVSVMNFMQTDGLIFLIPLLLPFFIGSLVLATGLYNQGMLSSKSKNVFPAALITGIASTVAAKILNYEGQAVTLTALGIFAAGQALIGFELIKSSGKENMATAFAFAKQKKK